MANSIFIWPTSGTTIVTGPMLFPDGSATAPSIGFVNSSQTGFFLRAGSNDLVLTSAGVPGWLTNSSVFRLQSTSTLEWSSGNPSTLGPDLLVGRDAANVLAQRNGTSAQAYRLYGYLSGSRSTYEAIQAVTTAVTLSGATTGTGNVIPAGATVVDIATTTTTTITGASGYQVGDGSDADRYGDITGTAVGTNSDAADYTADPRWWATSARAVTLTAKTSNFTGGVVQVTVFYMAATAA